MKISFLQIKKVSIFKKIYIFLFIFFSILSPLFVSEAAINKQINYQGKLTTSAGVAVANGTYIMEFKLYTVPTAGTAIWAETRTGGDEVQITNGLFSVMLGEVTALTGVDFNQTLYLGVKVESDTEMTPRKKLGSVPSAVIAEGALNILGGSAGNIPFQTGAGATSFSSNLFWDNTGGMLGIRTTSPTSVLSVNGSNASENSGISISNTDSVGNVWKIWQGTAGNYDGYLKFGLNPTNANDWDMTLDNSGRLVVPEGVSTPYFRSPVLGLGDTPILQWVGTGSNYNGTVKLGVEHPYGNHGVDVILSPVSGYPGNASGTSFRIINQDSLAEYFRVNNLGNVGIGATTPNQKLSVYDNYAVLGLPDGNSYYFDGGIEVSGTLYPSVKLGYKANGGSVYAGLIDSDNYDLALSTGGTTAMTILNSNRNVGIGTTAPSSKLDVNGNINALSVSAGTISSDNTDGSPYSPLIFKSDAWGLGNKAFSFLTYNNSGSGVTNEKFTIYNGDTGNIILNGIGGNVGIGTTTPSSKLEVINGGIDNGTRFDGIRSIVTGANTSAVAGYFSTSGYNNTLYALQTGEGAISFGTTGTSDLTLKGYIDESGIPSPTYGNLSLGDSTSSFAAGVGGQLSFRGTTAGTYANANAVFGSIRGIKETATYLSSLGALTFSTQSSSAQGADLSTSTEKMRITSDGSVGIGTTSPTFKLETVGTARFKPDGNAGLGIGSTWSGTNGFEILTTGDHFQLVTGGGRNISFQNGGALVGGTAGARLDLTSGTNGYASFSTGDGIGGASHIERMRIAQNGNVGIGTTTPNGNGITTIATGNLMIMPGTTNQYSWWNTYNYGIGFPHSTNPDSYGPGALITAVPNGAYGADIQFVSQAVSGAGVQENMRITTDGKVGIGTTAPENKLHINDSTLGGGIYVGYSAPGLHLGNNTIMASATNLAEVGLSTGPDHYLTGAVLGDMAIKTKALNGGTAGNILFGIGTSEKVRITTTGNVGIGTASPLAKLDVGGILAMNDNPIYLRTGVDGVHSIGYSSGILLQSNSPVKFHDATSNLERVRIDLASGNVGIGTTAPVDILQIGSVTGQNSYFDSSVSGLHIRYATYDRLNLTSNVGVAFGGGLGSGLGGIRMMGADNTSYSYVLSGATNELLLNPNGGNVGIGTTNPVNKLQVVKDGGGDIVRLTSTTSGDAILALAPAGGTANAARISGTPVSTQTELSFSTAGLDRVRIDRNGNVGIGTASPTSRIHGVTTLSAATGNEVAYSLNYTTNKATSGNDTGLLINMTDTLSPGASYPLNINVGGVSKFSVDNIGNIKTTGSITIAANEQFSSLGDLYVSSASGSNIYFRDGSSTNMFIENTGNVGIGTTAPTSKLYVKETDYTKYALSIENEAGSYNFGSLHNLNVLNLSKPSGIVDLRISSPDNSDTQISFSGAGERGTFTVNGNYDWILNANSTYGTGRIILNDGTAGHTGNVGIGTTNPQGKLNIVMNGGISGATANSDGSGLVVDSLTANTGISVLSADALQSNYILGSPANALAGLIRWDNAANLMSVGTNNSSAGLRLMSGVYGEAVRILANGNVGIGTTAPIARLDVRSGVNAPFIVNPVTTLMVTGPTVNAADNVSAPNAPETILTLARAGVAGQVYSSTAKFDLSKYQADGYGRTQLDIKLNDTDETQVNVMTLRANGNVGIGTTTPTDPLVVNGHIRILADSGELKFLNDSRLSSFGNDLYLYNANASKNLYFGTENNTKVTILANGNVGIGTTAPTQKLSVAGSIEAYTGTSSASDYANRVSSLIMERGDLLNSYPHKITNSWSDTAANDSMSFELSPSNSTVTVMTLLGNGNVGIGTTGPAAKLNVSDSGAQGFEIEPNAAGFVSLQSYNRNTSVFSPTSLSAEYYNINTGVSSLTTAMRINSNGNVGIGTTAPNQLLQVNGIIGATKYNDNLSGSNALDFTTANNPVFYGYNSTNLDTIQASSPIIFKIGGAEKMRVDGTTGNVGIGTASPLGKLSVSLANATAPATVSTTGFDSTYAVFGGSGAPITGSAFGIGFESGVDKGANLLSLNPNSDWMPINYYGNKHKFYILGAEKMRIDELGNVGIGTTSPGLSLDVNGDIRGGNLYASTNLLVSGKIYGQGGTGYPILFANRNTGAEWMRIDNGNVGIGTTGPGSKLDIVGLNTGNAQSTLGLRVTDSSNDTKFSVGDNGVVIFGKYGKIDPTQFGEMTIGHKDLAAFGTNFAFTQNSSGQTVFNGTELHFRIGNATKMYVKSDGNVGIGTTGPTSRLQSTGATSGLPTLGLSTNGGFYLTNTDVNYGLLMGVNGSTGDAWQQVQRTDGTATAYNLLLQPSGGNVGIGTTAPSEKLEVHSAGSTATLRVQGDWGSDSARLTLTGNGNTNHWDITAAPSDTLIFSNSNTAKEPLTLLSNGNVGIGTTAPDSVLTLDSASAVSGDYLLKAKGTLVNGGIRRYGNNIDFIGYQTVLNQVSAFDSSGLKLINNSGSGIMIDNSGNVGIGTTTFDATNPEKLLVNAGNTSSVNAISATGSINSYLQLNIKNTSTGTSASSDIVATADNGSETTNFIDMGINGSGYTGGVFGGANDAYLYNLGQNMLIGTGTASKDLFFLTGGTNASTNTRMTVLGSNGFVGIGTTTPSSKLDITTTALGVTQTDSSGLALVNTTPAAAGAQQISPAIRWRGFGWGTTAGTSQAVDWRASVLPVQSTVPTSTWSLASSINGGAYTNRLSVTSAGLLTASGGLAGTTGAFSSAITNTQSLTTTPTNGFAATAASALVGTPVRISPSVIWSGSAWNTTPTAATKANAIEAYLLPVTGATTSGSLVFANRTVNGIANATEIMRLTTAGNVGIGANSPSNILHVTGTPTTGVWTARIANTLGGTSQNNGLLILAGNNTGVAASEMITFQRPDATVIGSISQNAATTIAFNTSSDRRIKENIVPTAYGLSDLRKIVVSDFAFINDSNKQVMTGFIAQDLNNIFPGAVTTNGDDGIGALESDKTPWMIDYSKLTPLLVKSVQDIDLNLEGIAGTITPLAGSENETFVNAFFENVKTKIGTWLADAGNGIKSIFADEIEIKILCVSNESGEKTCITKEQLDALLINATATAGQAGTSPSPEPTPLPSTPPTEPEPTPEESVPTEEEQAPETIPEVTPEPIPETTPEVAPEPEPTPEPEATPEPTP